MLPATYREQGMHSFPSLAANNPFYNRWGLRKRGTAPPVRMIKLTAAREITAYKWVHPEEDR